MKLEAGLGGIRIFIHARRLLDLQSDRRPRCVGEGPETLVMVGILVVLVMVARCVVGVELTPTHT